MKKFTSLILAAALVAVVALAGLIPAPAMAAEGTPCNLTLALPGGATNVGSDLYDEGIMTPANTALRPLAVSWTYSGTVATNGTIILRKSAGGPIWATISHGTGGGAAYKGVSLITSEWYWLRGDTIHVTASVTNPCSVVIHTLER